MAFPDPKPHAAIESLKQSARLERERAQTLRQRARLAREQAASCEARAARLQALLLGSDERSQTSRAAMREVFDQVASRHLVSAQMQEMLAVRLEAWHNRNDSDIRPIAMDAIVAQLGMASALVKLRRQHALAIAVASDRTAQAAHALELVTAEGPATDAIGGAQLTAVGSDLLDRWPSYGRAVEELGIHAVCAAPLGSPAMGIGALCAYDTVPEAPRRTATATKLMAGALTQMLAGGSALDSPDEQTAIPALLDASNNQSVVPQAVGMVRDQCGCRLEDAADLLAARAFAEDMPLAEVARQVLSGEIQL